MATNHIDEEMSPLVTKVWEMLRHVKGNLVCCALGCTESLQSSGRLYQRCSHCCIVGYSGRTCQTCAWTDKWLPHQDIWKKMAQVANISGKYLDNEKESNFVATIQRIGITQSVLIKVFSWLSNLRVLMATTDGTPAPDMTMYNKYGVVIR